MLKKKAISYRGNHITVPLRKRLTDGLRQTAGNNGKETQSSVPGQDERGGRNDKAMEGYKML